MHCILPSPMSVPSPRFLLFPLEGAEEIGLVPRAERTSPHIYVAYEDAEAKEKRLLPNPLATAWLGAPGPIFGPVLAVVHVREGWASPDAPGEDFMAWNEDTPDGDLSWVSLRPL